MNTLHMTGCLQSQHLSKGAVWTLRDGVFFGTPKHHPFIQHPERKIQLFFFVCLTTMRLTLKNVIGWSAGCWYSSYPHPGFGSFESSGDVEVFGDTPGRLTAGWLTNRLFFERNMIWTKPPWLCEKCSKSPYWEGKASSKAPFLGSPLIFQGV